MSESIVLESLQTKTQPCLGCTQQVVQVLRFWECFSNRVNHMFLYKQAVTGPTGAAAQSGETWLKFLQLSSKIC